MKRYLASAIQKQFWLLHKLQPENTAYNIPSLFFIEGKLDASMLKESLGAVVDRHEVLRSTYSYESGQLFQCVHDTANVEIERSRLQDVGVTGPVPNEILGDVCKPFDLQKGPLFRANLYKVEENKYYLLFTMHHIVVDLHSKNIFARELSYFFNAILSGKQPESPCDVNQYHSYSQWQHAFLQGNECKESLAYWKNGLGGHKLYLNLPLDKPRPVVQNTSGAAVFFNLPSGLTRSLKQLGKANNVPIYLISLTAYLVLLNRYSGQSEITLGVPFTNRRHEDHKDTFGCFVNVLPVTFTFDPAGAGFSEVLQVVRRQMLKAHRNQEIPYESIVNEVQPTRDPSYNPLFQAGFTFEPPMELFFEGLSVKGRKVHNCGAQMDLYANLWEKDDELHGYFEYSSAIFKKNTIERFVQHYRVLLQSISENLSVPVDRLPILPVEERQLLLKSWNNTEKEFGDSDVLQHLFNKQVEKTPDRIAGVFQDRHLSYRQLDEKTTQLAHLLRSKGVGPGVFVGVYLLRSLDMFMATLAVLKAGGAFVPLDPEFPQDRIAYMVEDSGLSILLSQSALSGRVPTGGFELFFVDTKRREVNNFPANKLGSGTTGDDLAYMIYTSGSTGKPKGVKVHHRALVNFLKSMEEEPGISGNDTLLAVTTLSFDIAMLELFLPIIVGAKVVVAPKESVVDGEQLLQMVAAEKVTVMQATPTTWRLLIGAGWQGGDLKALCGGEPMPSDLAKDLLERASSVWNLYGPTETTIWSTCHQVSRNDDMVLVGRPIANTQTYIVDKYDQPTPIGVAGELLIGGSGVTKGYHKRPKLNDQSFIPDSFSERSGQILYRTGDKALYLPDGNIKLLGRIDHQIKLRGYRIELGEIESVLLDCEDIGQAAVLVRDFGDGDQRLVAYYTVTVEGEDTEKYKNIMLEKLPRYMVPSFFMELIEMPLTANGKIDRKNLPIPTVVLGEDVQQVDASTVGGVEVELCDIWGEVLLLHQVGVHDNFFDIGGNSLLILQLQARIENKFHVQVPAIKLFQYPTVSSFAAYLAEESWGNNDASISQQASLRKKALQKQARRLSRRKR